MYSTCECQESNLSLFHEVTSGQVESRDVWQLLSAIITHLKIITSQCTASSRQIIGIAVKVECCAEGAAYFSSFDSAKDQMFSLCSLPLRLPLPRLSLAHLLNSMAAELSLKPAITILAAAHRPQTALLTGAQHHPARMSSCRFHLL